LFHPIRHLAHLLFLRCPQAIRFFGHTTERPGLVVGGVDGSGDYPALSYGDSFVYVTVAHGTRYVSHPVSGLKEQPAESAGRPACPCVHGHA
jgi:hypothetical protein